MQNISLQIRLLLVIIVFFPYHVFPQEHVNSKYTIVKEIKVTPVKDQEQTNTCWSYATVSFIEAEALRLGNGVHDLSDMYFVYASYLMKVSRMIEKKGQSHFSDGGLAHDVLKAINQYGMVPEEVFPGFPGCPQVRDHNEMRGILTAMTNEYIANGNINSPTRFFSAFEGVLNSYLGTVPKIFKYGDKFYNPQSFAKEVIGIKPEDYVEITSYSNSPFYKKFVLDIPDNWSKDEYFNIPVDEITQIIDYAIDRGFTIAWDGDVSENEFNHFDGIASYKEKKTNFEKKISQELRQVTFDDKTTTDDHLMHITGIAKDSTGIKYYITKNSWGITSNTYGGYLCISEAYVRLKTISILVHKDAIPPNIAKKMFEEKKTETKFK